MKLIKLSSMLSVALLVAATANGCSSNPPADDDSGTNPDGSVTPKDSGKDAVTKTDTGGGQDVTPPTTCTPADVSGFTPSASLHGNRAPSASCTQTQIDTYWSSCLDKATASSSKCSAFTGNTANKACATCVTSNSTDALWGPLIQGKGIVSANVAGCLEIKTGDKTTGGCAYKWQSQRECVKAACDANCPVTDDASFQEYTACTTEAADNGCKTYSDASDAACNADANPAAQACFGQSFQDYYDIIVPLFCLDMGDGGSGG